ncbi:hypothetical protein DYB37_010254 [Aphanomyces astaci]|uniref:DDE Tnp4 domain-containing protein n=1 Tax=Aphanomyces astaci TaxID=112090 RepID=A0A3R7BHV8_APHAT|nr:hypothetical protein DYB37_010254 [Aphanomyces astaci]
MNVLLTFDFRRQIRHVVAGWPGSVHDSTVWASSAPFLRPRSFFDPNQYQAGDSGFALGANMLTPYRLPAAHQDGNDTFNTGHASLRVVCEHGNGLLKGRWSSLALLPVDIRRAQDVKFVCDWILAYCVLHNIVNRLRNGDDDVQMYYEKPRPKTFTNCLTEDSYVEWRENIKAELLVFLGLTSQ